MLRSSAALIELAKYSLDEYRQLDSDSPGVFSFGQKGLLLLAETKQGLALGMATMELVAKHGIDGRKLDVDATRELEPAVTDRIIGGVYFPNEAYAEPLATVKALMNRAMKLGVTFLRGLRLHPPRNCNRVRADDARGVTCRSVYPGQWGVVAAASSEGESAGTNAIGQRVCHRGKAV
jgi:D-amino-acid dehydrogenase